MTMIDTTGKTLDTVLTELNAALVKQGKQCTVADDCIFGTAVNCAYGDDKGNHCAVGWFLDENNKDLMGFMGPLNGLMEAYGGCGVLGTNDAFIREHTKLLRDMQDLHDVTTLEALDEARRNLSTKDRGLMSGWITLRESQITLGNAEIQQGS